MKVFTTINDYPHKTYAFIAKDGNKIKEDNAMKNYTVEFKTESGAYQNVIGDYIQASSPAEALSLARQWLLDNGMDPIEVSALTYFNKIHEEGDNFWTWAF